MFGELRTRQSEAGLTTPLTAALAAFTALGSNGLGLVTPYIGPVNNILVQHIQAAGDWTVR